MPSTFYELLAHDNDLLCSTTTSFTDTDSAIDISEMNSTSVSLSKMIGVTMNEHPLQRLNFLLSGQSPGVQPDPTADQPTTLQVSSHGIIETQQKLTIPQDLIVSSVLDRTSNTYPGPPIGFAACTIIHTNPTTGLTTTSYHGTLAAPRPVVALNCTVPGCMTCHPPP